MKKQYIQPTTKVVVIRAKNHFLTLSGDYVKSGYAGSGENLSRGGGFSAWDDEE